VSAFETLASESNGHLQCTERVRCTPVLNTERSAKARGHRTHTTERSKLRLVLTGLKLKELYKTLRSPDSHHRTLQTASGACRPVPYPSWARHCLHRMLRLSVRCSRSQRPVHSRDLSNFPTGAIEDMHFNFSKSTESRRERNPSSLYPSNSTPFSKCDNTTKCVPTSARVLAFSQSFSSKELS